ETAAVDLLRSHTGANLRDLREWHGRGLTRTQVHGLAEHWNARHVFRRDTHRVRIHHHPVMLVAVGIRPACGALPLKERHERARYALYAQPRCTRLRPVHANEELLNLAFVTRVGFRHAGHAAHRLEHLVGGDLE